MAVDLSKVMDLADGLEIYKDLRDRIKNIPVPEVPVEDVQINETSILQNGIANIPTMSTNNFGVAKLGMKYNTGITINNSGELKISPANITNIQSSPNLIQPLVSYFVPDIAFFGLAKAAGDITQSQASTTAHTYTDAAKQAILKMLGLDGILGDFESSAVASKAYAIGETFVYNGKRYRATAAIAISDVIAPGTNCVLDPLDGRIVKFGNIGAGLFISSSGEIVVNRAAGNTIKQAANEYTPISPAHQHTSVFYGLAKAAGADMASLSGETVGVYPQAQKTAIQNMLGVPVASDEDAMEIITQYPKTWEVSA